MDANGIDFFVSSSPSGTLSISDGQTVTVAGFIPYTYTNISNFGNVTWSGSGPTNVTIGGDTRTLNSPVSLSLQPGWISFGNSGTSQWDLAFVGDRKSLSLYLGSTSGSGTHSGAIPGVFHLSEVNDDPVAVIQGSYNPLDAAHDLFLDSASSYDVDSTGSIVSWTWDVFYDGASFDADYSGQSLLLDRATLEALYPEDGIYNLALRVTDNSGATHTTTYSYNFVSVPEPSSGLLVAAGASGILFHRRRHSPEAGNARSN
ncbi:MAG: PEP-CTERM sorting domain-containing protein [Verrucomicrobiae bacterium]|nr:PEP-CTERM sorting domain-containing protein [Verrucomicrobiae bacterium]